MTAKEEAIELLDKFFGREHPNYQCSHDPYIDRDLAKKCALICVDEILRELEEKEDGYRMDRVEYWEQVKKEINKL